MMTPLDILLDIAPGPWPRRPIRRPVIPDTLKPAEKPELPDTTDTITSVTDTITAPADTINAPTDSINALAGNFGSTTGSDDTTAVFWTIIAVLFALCVCFYFVLSYRRMANRKAYSNIHY